ncbi:MAG: 23S rRNA (pseudouridine(1915)-N(3))-methyltransferase RlmH [Azospirillaceae bacterium]
MRLTVIAVGKLRGGPIADLVADYARRSPWPLSVREVEARRPGVDRREAEADLLLAAVPEGATVVALDERGAALDSAAFAARLGDWREQGVREVAFLIGGADGLAERARRRADVALAFGPATWPHLLVRAMLAEQLYRAQTILSGHPYHRGG